jgi:hypothetical protein
MEAFNFAEVEVLKCKDCSPVPVHQAIQKSLFCQFRQLLCAQGTTNLYYSKSFVSSEQKERL